MAEQSDQEEDNDYLDTLLQESIDAVNSRSFGGHALRHQQVPHEEMVSSSDEEIENDSSSPVHLDAVQQKSGNERKRYVQSSFDAHFNKFLDFREKYGHCDASQIGENASLGRWCNELRVSYNKIQKNQKPNMKLLISDEQIQRLNDSGFKWSLRESFLTSASMISWLSKQSMVIVMFLVLVRMCRLGDGVIN